MKRRLLISLMIGVLLVACSLSFPPTLTSVPPTPTSVPHTSTSVPPTPIFQIVSPTKTPTQEPLAETATLPPDTPIFTPLDGAVLWANSFITNTEWDEWIDLQTRNLALPSPYLWEFYGLPASTRYQDVYDHYYNLLTGLGYRLTLNEQFAYEVFLMKFIGPSYAVTIQFFGSWSGYEPALLLLLY